MKRKNFAPISVAVGVVLVVAVAGGVLYYAVQHSLNSLSSQGEKPQESSSTEQIAIQQLEAQWESISHSVPFPFTLGARAWALDSIQFIGNSRILIQFEDGHVVHTAILQYIASRFMVMRFFPQMDFSSPDWQQLVKDYGDSAYAISTYTWNSTLGQYASIPVNVFITGRSLDL